MAELRITSSTPGIRCGVDINVNVPDVVTYHIYSDGTIEKHIPKEITKGYEDKYKYVYHKKQKTKDTTKDDKTEPQKQEEDIEITVCTLSVKKVKKRGNGRKEKIIPKGLKVAYTYPKGGNAQEAYIDQKGTIYVKGTRYGIISYPVAQGQTELVRMPDGLSISKNGVNISFQFGSTKRRYCNPDTMAGFIGALAYFGKTMICNGMCFEDATSYPSLTHPNGDSADTQYSTNLATEQKKVKAFILFHFTRIFRGKGSWYPLLKGTKYVTGHETHLHAGDFDTNKITIKQL